MDAIDTVVPAATEPRIFKVPEQNVDALKSRLAKLIKRSEKLGVAAPVVEECGTHEETIQYWYDDVQKTRIVRYSLFKLVQSTEVRFAGWKLAAVVDYLYGEDGRVNLLRAVPGAGELPKKYREEDATCDHCNTSRRRNQTFVVHHADSNDYKRIGRNCIADFLGHVDAEQLLAYSQYVCEIGSALEEGEGGFGGGHVWRFGMSEVLALTSVAIRKNGWMSRGKAREFDKPATADGVWSWLTYYLRRPMKGEPKPPVPEAGDIAVAEAALEWARAIPADVDSDYLYNVRAVTVVGSVTGKEIGIACSITAAYLREQEKLVLRKRAESKPSTYLGTVGVRFGGKGKGALPALNVEVLGVYAIQTDFGATTILRMQTAEGNDLVTFYSGDLPAGIVPGTRLKVTGTVKRHEEDKRSKRPTTNLSRCKFEILDAVDAADTAKEGA